MATVQREATTSAMGLSHQMRFTVSRYWREKKCGTFSQSPQILISDRTPHERKTRCGEGTRQCGNKHITTRFPREATKRHIVCMHNFCLWHERRTSICLYSPGFGTFVGTTFIRTLISSYSGNNRWVSNVLVTLVTQHFWHFENICNETSIVYSPENVFAVFSINLIYHVQMPK